MNEEENISNSFAVVLSELDRGSLIDKASDELKKLIQAVSLTEKAGTITLKLKVHPTRTGKTVEIEGIVEAKRPKAPASPSLWYVTKDFELSRKDPNQSEFKFRELEIGEKPAPRGLDEKGHIVPRAVGSDA